MCCPRLQPLQSKDLTDVSVTFQVALKYRSEGALRLAGSYGIASLFLLLVWSAWWMMLCSCSFCSFSFMSSSYQRLFLPFSDILTYVPLSVCSSTHLFIESCAGKVPKVLKRLLETFPQSWFPYLRFGVNCRFVLRFCWKQTHLLTGSGYAQNEGACMTCCSSEIKSFW